MVSSSSSSPLCRRPTWHKKKFVFVVAKDVFERSNKKTPTIFIVYAFKTSLLLLKDGGVKKDHRESNVEEEVFLFSCVCLLLTRDVFVMV